MSLSKKKHIRIAGAAGATILLLLGLLYHQHLWEVLRNGFRLATDRERMECFLASLGAAAPAAFIAIQVMQVIFAPFPGEISGFIGGYLFGTLQGFFYSSIGLTVGSWINFSIGRVMGKRYIRKRIPADKLARFDKLVNRQGLIFLFFLFVFPGFPKDYLCLFLGLSGIPLKAFLVMATVGRMPGTLMLSLQGAALFDKMYGAFAAILAVCLLSGILAYRYRDHIYDWAERSNDP